MPLEIERKFLVNGDFYPFVIKKERIVQAYLAVDIERTIRIRIKDNSAFLTVKGGAIGTNGFSRLEFEYLIPAVDAQQMLKLALPSRIEKERHYVPFEGRVFEVDVFHGRNEGLVIAELELTSELEPFDRPDWLGEEVTGDEKYYNAYLASH